MSDQEVPVIDPQFDEKKRDAFLAFLAGETDDFNANSVDPGKFARVSRDIPGLIVTSAGGAMPYQADGTLHGYPFYFRYRSGHASLNVGERDGDTLSAASSLWSASMQYGYYLDGSLSMEEFGKLMCSLVLKLERSPFCYEFPCQKIEILPGSTGENLQLKVIEGEQEVQHGWGHTAEEAFATLREPSLFLREHGWTDEQQLKLYEARSPQPTPLNKPSRNYPAVEPKFELRDFRASS